MIAHVRLPSSAPAAALGTLRDEFPSLDFRAEDVRSDDLVVLAEAVWEKAVSFAAADERMRGFATNDTRTLAVCGTPGSIARTTSQILTRYQRFIRRRNGHSESDTFDRVLDEHAKLHASEKPLVVADFDHAIDTWQWMLRLEPDASAAAQMAALFHDVERLLSECEKRVEHLAPDYQEFKNAHARRGAAFARELLTRAGVPPAQVSRAAELIEAHEQPGADAELALLNDADALSFFSLNSSGYVDYFGVEQARRKVRYTLSRLRTVQRTRITQMRLRSDVAALVSEETHP